jgi:HK97 gp10 family phage protein
MANAPKPVEIKKGEVTFVSSVDRCQYTITELSKMALRDVAKLLRQRVKAKDNMPELTGNLKKNVGTWVRINKQTGRPELQIGVYNKERAKKRGLNYAFYAPFLEFGTKNRRAINGGKGFLKHIVESSIDDIRKIEGQYLEAVEDENRALGLIEDGEEIADD